ncbi:MAG: ATPase [Elusimicrobia bacterium RBG_16_66_12]|nr:MAG: ATPase [Elusimicrobia bacterium RBG_16_66_12]
MTAEPGKQEVIMMRTFDATCELVFKAHMDPNAIPKWWGRKNSTTTVDRMEVREGGRWRFVERTADGGDYGFHGVYHAIVAPERIVQTFEFEGVPGHVILETLTLVEQGGVTTLTSHSVYQSVEDRDGMVQSGMEDGANESMDRLAELLGRMT